MFAPSEPPVRRLAGVASARPRTAGADHIDAGNYIVNNSIAAAGRTAVTLPVTGDVAVAARRDATVQLLMVTGGGVRGIPPRGWPV